MKNVQKATASISKKIPQNIQEEFSEHGEILAYLPKNPKDRWDFAVVFYAEPHIPTKVEIFNKIINFKYF